MLPDGKDVGRERAVRLRADATEARHAKMVAAAR
jgi:hypothetical protein